MIASVQRESGYSLLELLVVCIIFSLLCKAALNGFPELMESVQRNTARQQLEFDLQRARSEALGSGSRVIFAISAGGNTYTVGKDSYPFSGTLSADETLFRRELPNGFSLSVSSAIVFSSSGYLIDSTGALNNSTLSLSDGESTFLNASIYPVGGMEYDG